MKNGKWRKTMSKIDIKYLAGFFDGEGCISIKKQSKYSCGIKKTVPQVSVKTTKEEEPELFKNKFGGCIISISHKKSELDNHNKQDIWDWELTNQKSMSNFLEKITPHLKGKKEVAKLMKEFLKYYSSNSGRPKVKKKDAKKRLEIAREISKKNRGIK